MPDIPRDPRQLARDILAGKISLEDVAREQARRAGVPPPQARPGAIQPQKLPDRIPLPRQIPQQPARRTTPPPQPVRQPQARKSAPTPPSQQRRPAPRSFPPSAPPPPPTLPAPARQLLAAAASPAAPPAAQFSGNLRSVLRRPATLRQAILLAEILNKPLALRDELPW
ncbi:MAG TPA: hypothetical protein VHQ47_02105 [Phycisphaerae bacterium]|nr:hypothetical protein [Phycisphaerae bacterium]